MEEKRRNESELVSCDQCEYSGSYFNLRIHKKSKHEGVSYSCDQCEYSAGSLSNLKRHKESKHEVIETTVVQHEAHELATSEAISKEPPAVIEPESVSCDLESKIEVEEDILFKTESSDLSEFIDQCHREDAAAEVGPLQGCYAYRETEEELNSEPVTFEEFFPHVFS